MTNNAPGQPTDPRAGSSSQPGRSAYNPIRIENPGNHQQPDWFESLETPHAQMLVALLFALIFGIAWRRPEFSPLTIVVVVGCLLYRLEPWQRKLATVPLLLAGIRFYLLLPAYSAEVIGPNPIRGNPSSIPGGELGIPWILAFLSVCLFFMPRKESATLKIVVVESIAVVLSSLLPGEGFLTILAIFNYTLFFAVTIGLFVDLKGMMKEEA
jgi:hypothetical protein